MQQKPKKHQLFRKHRIVLWEQKKGIFGIGKIVDSTITQNVLLVSLKVGNIIFFKHDPISELTIKNKKIWLSHIFTHHAKYTAYVPISSMRLPSYRHRAIYDLYRKCRMLINH